MTSRPGDQWVHEIKHDGYRLMVRRVEELVRIYGRRRHDWPDRFPWIVEGVRRLHLPSVLLDGERVGCGPDGVSDLRAFTAAHAASHAPGVRR